MKIKNLIKRTNKDALYILKEIFPAAFITLLYFLPLLGITYLITRVSYWFILLIIPYLYLVVLSTNLIFNYSNEKENN